MPEIIEYCDRAGKIYKNRCWRDNIFDSFRPIKAFGLDTAYFLMDKRIFYPLNLPLKEIVDNLNKFNDFLSKIKVDNGYCSWVRGNIVFIKTQETMYGFDLSVFIESPEKYYYSTVIRYIIKYVGETGEKCCSPDYCSIHFNEKDYRFGRRYIREVECSKEYCNTVGAGASLMASDYPQIKNLKPLRIILYYSEFISNEQFLSDLTLTKCRYTKKFQIMFRNHGIVRIVFNGKESKTHFEHCFNVLIKKYLDPIKGNMTRRGIAASRRIFRYTLEDISRKTAV